MSELASIRLDFEAGRPGRFSGTDKKLPTDRDLDIDELKLNSRNF